MGAAHGDLLRAPTPDIENLCACFKIDPLAVHFVLVRIIRVDALDEQIHYIGTHIGETPGDIIIMSDHYPGNARK